MRRRPLAAALAFCGMLTAAALTGCGSGSSSGASAPSHPTFMYLQTDGSQSYFVLEAAGAKAEAARLGATVKVSNENNSSSTTISDIQTAIGQQANGLIVVAPDSTLGPRMVNLAKTANVAIMASDNGFAGSDGKQVPFVGIDAAAFGQSTEAAVARLAAQAAFSRDEIQRRDSAAARVQALLYDTEQAQFATLDRLAKLHAARDKARSAEALVASCTARDWPRIPLRGHALTRRGRARQRLAPPSRGAARRTRAAVREAGS